MATKYKYNCYCVVVCFFPFILCSKNVPLFIIFLWFFSFIHSASSLVWAASQHSPLYLWFMNPYKFLSMEKISLARTIYRKTCIERKRERKKRTVKMERSSTRENGATALMVNNKFVAGRHIVRIVVFSVEFFFFAKLPWLSTKKCDKRAKTRRRFP